MIGHIYSIRCKANNRVYIGSSVQVKRRFYLHKRDLMAGCHHSPRLQAAWNKYGPDAFDFDIVEQVDDVLFLLAREQFWIWRTERISMNCAQSAMSPLGVKRTQEQKSRMQAAKRAHYGTPEGKAHLAAMHAKNRGRIMSNDERARRSASAKGKVKGPLSESHKEALRRAWQVRKINYPSKPLSEETKQRISSANKGRKRTAETIKKAVDGRLSFITKELPYWLQLKSEGKSYREIERITGRFRTIIARECKKILEQ